MKNDNIYLRPIENSDLDIMNKWKNDKNVFEFLGGGYRPTSKSEQQNWLQNMVKMNQNQRFIICNNDNSPLGMIGLYSISNINQNAEVGLYIGESSERGKGYGYQAVALLEDYAVNYLNIHKFKISVVEKNISAINFWNKNEYQTIGKLKRERYINGEFVDVLMMEKLVFSSK